MGFHPINLFVRFILEVAALAGLAWWGWQTHTGMDRLAFCVLTPALVATIWGMFAVPGDRSRHGDAPVPVPGAIRLILELAIFAAAVIALALADMPVLALLLAAAVLVHYLLSADRVNWLVHH
ncbi:YrdB family protein [Silvimonas amylolytica]|uniref:DUF2568 domain-containing protein n=1 Tax=Silvimonas amylolytica TaxID=449663 RepID=A0ABQ2PK80_9NEIS|nr:YrdB family protein [Silvimonas amylolytica]GGP25635.1 hypothetical protein GCM10010971_14540 [Silvimonas amylolytica]